ncbi:hypothetical protein D3C76_1359520 [compost metagenome]
MGFIYAHIPEDMGHPLANRFLTVMNKLQPHQRAMLESSFDEYKKRCGVHEPMLPYYVYAITMYECFILENEERTP